MSDGFGSNDIMTPQELESFEIINFNKDLSSFDDLQIIEDEKSKIKEKDINNVEDVTDVPKTQYSDLEEEEYFKDDIWDDFELARPYMEKFDNKHTEKVTKKASKLQKRHKAMVRYKNPIITVNFDEPTKFLLRRLVVTRWLSRYNHIIGTGSNSILLYGNGSTCFMRLPWEVVVKVYENNEAASQRAQNELKSIDRLRRCRINSPVPVCAWRNIIVMGAIGHGKTAPSITTAPPELVLKNYLHIIDSMKRMYQIAKVVHGNLSHRSIMWYGEPYFISLAHSVPADHEDALKLLIKDCYNVTHVSIKSRIKKKELHQSSKPKSHLSSTSLKKKQI